MPVFTALLVSADPLLIESVKKALHRINDLRLAVVAGRDDVFSQAQQDDVALVLVHLPAADDGAWLVALLRRMGAAGRRVPVLVLCEKYDPDQSASLLRLGAADCLGRPLDLGRLAFLADFLTVRARGGPPPERPESCPVRSLGETEPFLYTATRDMERLVEQVRRIALQDTTLLLTGETGTGKTRLARLIHEMSPRRDEPFLVVNCGSLSATLMESEMFGHVRGAFTGADRDRAGKFAEAGRGTLLLDEIDTLPLGLQAKLLRVVEERVFEPVGSNRPLAMRARLVAATNRPLDREVAARRFRADLYYRLNVVHFHLPPLRDERNLILPLALQLMGAFAARMGRKVQAIAPDALRTLQEHDWPGNIRELRNVIERAVGLCPGPEIRTDDLPDDLRRPGAEAGHRLRLDSASALGPPVTLSHTLEEAECGRIVQALRKHNNNRLRAAAELGISRVTLYKKLRRYGLMNGPLPGEFDWTRVGEAGS